MIDDNAAQKLIEAGKRALPILRAARAGALHRRGHARPTGVTLDTWRLHTDIAYTSTLNALHATGIDYQTLDALQ